MLVVYAELLLREELCFFYSDVDVGTSHRALGTTCLKTEKKENVIELNQLAREQKIVGNLVFWFCFSLVHLN